MKGRVLLAGLIAALALPGYVLADHLGETTEVIPYSETISVVVRGKTTQVVVEGTVTDRDPVPHPSTVTSTVTSTNTVTVTVTAATTTAPTTTTAPPPPASVTPPESPASYSVPAGATVVSSSTALAANLVDGVAEDIVLENGVYASSFALNQGDRLYARTLGGALLTGGVTVGSGTGSLIRGLSISATSGDAVVNYWGGSGHRILDTTIDGQKAVQFGVRSKAIEGFVAQRLVIRNVLGWGLYADTYPNYFYVPTVKPTFTDLNVANVSRAVPRSSDGTSEACVWIGVISNPVERLLLRQCAWEALWTGVSLRNTTFRDIDIATTDRAQVAGIYTEHYSWGAVFERFRIEGPRVGINNEWDYGNDRGACEDCIFQDGTIIGGRIGVGLEPGTLRSTVRRVKFIGQCWAAINDWDEVNHYSTQQNVYVDNDYTGLPAGVPAIRHEWTGTATC